MQMKNVRTLMRLKMRKNRAQRHRAQMHMRDIRVRALL